MTGRGIFGGILGAMLEGVCNSSGTIGGSFGISTCGGCRCCFTPGGGQACSTLREGVGVTIGLRGTGCETVGCCTVVGFVALLLPSRSATCLKASLIVSPLSTVGILLFSGFFKICRISDIACLTASTSVYTGMGVWFGMSCTVSVSTSLKVLGL